MNWSVWIPWQELGGSGTNQNIFKLLTLDNNGPGVFVFNLNELSRNFEAPKTETRVSGQRAKKSVCFFMHNFHYDSRRWMHWFSLVMTPINRPWFRNTKNHGTQNFEERLKKNNLAESVRCSKFESGARSLKLLMENTASMIWPSTFFKLSLRVRRHSGRSESP